MKNFCWDIFFSLKKTIFIVKIDSVVFDEQIVYAFETQNCSQRMFPCEIDIYVIKNVEIDIYIMQINVYYYYIYFTWNVLIDRAL